MILDSTKIAGDLKVAKGSYIYVSGTVNAPPLALLEDSAVASNETVLFSVEDEKPGTIKTSGTVIADNTITFPGESIVSTNEFIISASALTTATAINTQPAEGTVVAVCRKLNAIAPSLSANDRVYVSNSICYIYSATQPKGAYDTVNKFFDFVQPDRFVAPTTGILESVVEYRLITDRTFSPN